LETANGNATIDAALRAIERFEASTNYKPFRKFHIEQARSFRARLAEETNAKNRPPSAATVTSTLKHLRNFFLWLSREPGFRSALNTNDANYFTPSDQDVRVATARREKRVATLEEIRRVLALMPTDTAIERRNRAIVAFAILTGVRDGALTSFRLKHIDVGAQTLFQDAREVRTKGRKTFTSIFFPVGPEPREIVTEYVAMLNDELGFSDDDPLFPSTQSVEGKIGGLSSKACLEFGGAAPGQFDGFSATPLKPPSFPTRTRIAFETHSFALASAFAAPRRNGKSGAKIWDTKARRRHSLDMAKCHRIGTPKSCGRSTKPALILR
jgi:site-specific recombinase XerC